MVKTFRLALCLAALGVLLVIVGLATGMSGGSSGGCASRGPGSAPGQVPAGDPCDRSQAGWDQAGYAFIAPGVLALIGAASIRLTARR